MDFTILSETEGAAVIENGADKYLAINSGLKNKSFLGIDTSKLQSLPGLIVDGDDIENWKISGITEIEGITYYYGSYLSGKTLPDLDITPQILQELTTALHAIKDKNFPVRQFSTSSVYRTENGKILFFPPYLMDFLNSRRSGKNSIEMIDPWNNPKLGGDKGRSFTIAALAYKSISGENPFCGETEEEIQEAIAAKSYKSPLLFQADLKKEISDLIDLSFRGEGTLSQWKKTLNSWINEGSVNASLSEREKEEITALETSKENKRILKEKISRVFIKNKNRLIFSLIGVVLLGSILHAPISKYLEPPVTMGLSQREVIDLYYDSFRTLDTEIMEDCITSQAGKGDINEISTIYVTSRVRSSYEGSSGLISPQQWISEGKTPVEPGVNVWGISDLKIQNLHDDRFEATYIKWHPSTIDDPEDKTPRMPERTEVKDILHLSVIDDAWKIDELNRIY